MACFGNQFTVEFDRARRPGQPQLVQQRFNRRAIGNVHRLVVQGDRHVLGHLYVGPIQPGSYRRDALLRMETRRQRHSGSARLDRPYHPDTMGNTDGIGGTFGKHVPQVVIEHLDPIGGERCADAVAGAHAPPPCFV